MELILGYYLPFLISSNLYLFFCLILFWSKACIWYSYLILTAEADYLEQGIGVTTPRKREKKLPVFPGFTFYRSPTLVRSWNSYWFTIDVRLVNSLCSTLIYLYICWSLDKKHWTHKFILNVNKLALFELSVLNSTWKGRTRKHIFSKYLISFASFNPSEVDMSRKSKLALWGLELRAHTIVRVGNTTITYGIESKLCANAWIWLQG